MFTASHFKDSGMQQLALHAQGDSKSSKLLLFSTYILGLVLLLLAHSLFAHPYSLHTKEGSAETHTTVTPKNQQLPAEPLTEDIAQANILAAQYIEQGRQGNPDYYFPLAEKALRVWADKPHVPADILWLRAYLYQAQHDFARARQDLKQLLKQHPRHRLAGFSLAMLAQIQGDYPAAYQHCRQVAQAGHMLLSGLCQASVMSVNGKAEKAYELLERFSTQLGDDLHWQQWTWTMMADIAARLEQNERAQQHFQQALAIPLHDAYLNMRYADFLLAQQRPEAVLRHFVATEKQNDQLLLRQAQAAKKLQQMHLFNRYKKRLQQRVEEIIARHDDHHAALLAQYYLEIEPKPKQALQFAMLNWQTQKAQEDLRLLLKAAVLNNDKKVLQTVKQWLTQTGLQDRTIQNLLVAS